MGARVVEDGGRVLLIWVVAKARQSSSSYPSLVLLLKSDSSGFTRGRKYPGALDGEVGHTLLASVHHSVLSCLLFLLTFFTIAEFMVSSALCFMHLFVLRRHCSQGNSVPYAPNRLRHMNQGIKRDISQQTKL